MNQKEFISKMNEYHYIMNECNRRLNALIIKCNVAESDYNAFRNRLMCDSTISCKINELSNNE